MSVQRRPKKGQPKTGTVKWVVRYRDPSGREKSKSFPTRAEAIAHDEEQSRLLRRAEWVDTDNAPTLAEVWRSWEAAAERPSTGRIRKTIGANLHDLGGTKITRIAPSQLRTWQNHLANGRPWVEGCSGLAINTRANWWGQLQGCLNMAVTDGLLLVNPCSKVPSPRGRSTVAPRELPTATQIGDLVRHADATGNDVLATMVLLAASTGLRSGEVAGLGWQNVDRDGGCIHVVEQVTMGGEVAPLKTESSRRIVPIPSEIMSRLLRHRLRHPCTQDSFVFHSPTGAAFSSDRIAKLLRRVGDGKWTFHALRHFFASAMIRQGRSVKAVQTILGHSSAAMTLDIYSHMWPDENDLVRDSSSELVRDICGMGAGDGTAQKVP